MKKYWILAASISIMGSFQACKDNSNKQNLTQEVFFTKEGELSLIRAANDSVVVKLDIEIADNDYETQTGLMYRKSMQDNRGMLFIFPNEQVRAFYMKNTEFALDIIFLDTEQKIVSIQQNAKPLDPTSLPSDGPAKYVLEVNAGLIEQWGIGPGDRMEFQKN
ncbi:DUF192 domain-containing protein [Aureitalea marina]|uniref:DUF192 domain-containing protein n=1 Tax=Aureitalea marina TaxID=930804 RepID=A0A2S7KQJ2_9FLAO|nr:DUF192 domain-containing protein [Aureitalea marina]PQB04885.1 hypothetical protein BST85_08285 [Aureitalea marina]